MIWAQVLALAVALFAFCVVLSNERKQREIERRLRAIERKWLL